MRLPLHPRADLPFAIKSSIMPAPMAPVIQRKIPFQIKLVPADGTRLPFYESGDFETSRLFGRHLLELIRSIC
jgi:hypothetical protein